MKVIARTTNKITNTKATTGIGATAIQITIKKTSAQASTESIASQVRSNRGVTLVRLTCEVLEGDKA
jgi:hypothetical protein